MSGPGTPAGAAEPRCHARSVACKTENHILLGVNRTWVKYVEKGRFPNTRRYFQVTRCNHCIGRQACMPACPYDAIYIDPERNTAAYTAFLFRTNSRHPAPAGIPARRAPRQASVPAPPRPCCC